jgi:excisionase family DNA binding protein
MRPTQLAPILNSGLPAPARFISVKETAIELGIAEQTVRRLIANGEIPAVRMGYLLRVPRALLEEYLEENRVAAG